jgi:hypothetical protein
MSKRNEVNAAAIILLALLLGAALIFYIGFKAHAHAAEPGEYEVIVELRLEMGVLPPEDEDNFEKREQPREKRRTTYHVIRTLAYIMPGFSDFAACTRFLTEDESYLKRLGMLYEFEKKTYGKSISIAAHCGARVD